MNIEEILYKLESVRKAQEEVEDTFSTLKTKEEETKYKLNSMQYKVLRVSTMLTNIINELSKELQKQEESQGEEECLN